MAVRKARTIRGSLKRKGFREEAGTNHWKLVLQDDGRDTHIFTIVSYDGRDYDDSLLGIMARQELHISKKKLLSLIDCPMDESTYRQCLVEGGHLQE